MPRKQKSDNQLWVAAGVCLFLIALVWLVFGQTVGYGFVNYDDSAYVYKNPIVASGLTWRSLQLAFTRSYVSNWYPLTIISHMLDCQLFGLNPGRHHLVNVLLHTIAVLLLFFVLWQMTSGPSLPRDESVSPRRPDRADTLWRSAFVAAVFAIHPLHVESVAWISERKGVLSGVFFMLTLGAYAYYVRRSTVPRYITLSIVYALGLMAKPTLMTVPFVLLLLDYWPLERLDLDRKSITRAIVEKIPLFALAAVSCVITLNAQSPMMHVIRGLSFSVRLGHVALSCVTYIWQMFWPRHLAAFYPYSFSGHAAALAATFLIIVVSLAALTLHQTRPYLVTGWFCYLIMLLPVIGLVQSGFHGRADRYTYLPHIGLYLAATWLAADLAKTWRRSGPFLGVGAVIVLGILTWSAHEQTQHWRDSGTLWRHALAVTQNNYVAHNNLAAFLETGDEAVSHLRESIRLQAAPPEPHYHLARLLLDKGEFEEAVDHFQKTVAVQPGHAGAWSGLGDVFLFKGEPREAIRCYERALELAPETLSSLNGLGWILATSPDASLRDGIRAVQLAAKAVELSQWHDPITLRTLAAAYAEAGQFDEATAVARQALKLALTESNSDLASNLRLEIDLYQTKLPLRDFALTRSPRSP